MKLQASYYQQFDADLCLDVPAEGYGGWQRSLVEISPEHTALVVMHAWEFGAPEQFPGWYRCVEYIGRAQRICREVFPRLLGAARQAGFNVFHVAGGGDYYKKYPGYGLTESLHSRQVASASATPSGTATEPVAAEPAPVRVPSDPAMDRLHELRRQRVFVGPHNEADVSRGFAVLDFAPQARPLDDEPVAATSQQMLALCLARGINHLIYTGFAIDGCLLISPGGMIDMSRHGLMCSTIRQAVTAIENKDTARHERAKQLALWRVGLLYGFVFDLDDFVKAL